MPKTKEATITIYRVTTGAPITIPARHADHYIGKGYTKKKPAQSGTTKES